jgi:hypothetical protein
LLQKASAATPSWAPRPSKAELEPDVAEVAISERFLLHTIVTNRASAHSAGPHSASSEGPDFGLVAWEEELENGRPRDCVGQNRKTIPVDPNYHYKSAQRRGEITPSNVHPTTANGSLLFALALRVAPQGGLLPP